MSAPPSARAPSSSSGRALLAQVAQVARFFASSCLGLAVDLAVFSLVTAGGGPPWAANATSSACAVLTTYLAVTRYTYRARTSRSTLVRFALCYTASILLFSAVIDGLVAVTGWPALGAKLVVLAPSFVVNYLLSRWVFR